ncbi:hypothetical protein EHS25_005340 [Saitozyma podzolica]|uniref:Amine oxidase n=1 Tax=Saitozyma podzolica TaxID=1890683 RepID=A0A427XZF3_9TREE|nr:hypothetical protein EHS25_005340 [Saitozyma podzolica]
MELPEGAIVVPQVWPAGADDDKPSERKVFYTLYHRNPENNSPDSNHWGFPLPLVVWWDLWEQKVTSITYCYTGAEEDGRRLRTGPNTNPTQGYKSAEFFPELRGGSTRDDLKPLHVNQPEGPSFTVDGQLIQWQKWRFRVSFNYREGPVLHDVTYDGRRLFYRLSLSEMHVPYADPRPPLHLKQVFDFGDIGLGRSANSLENGFDCLGLMKYFDSSEVNSKGEGRVMKNVICCHEQDNGILWKHTNTPTGRAAVVRQRLLILQTIITVGNYDYIFAWQFDQVGGLHLDSRATGILSTSPIDPGKKSPFGTVVAPGVFGPSHQHFINLRIDPAIDGDNNTIVQEDVEACGLGPDDEHGIGFRVKQTPFKEAGYADANPLSGRVFKITNPNVINPISMSPVSYKLVPHPSQMRLAWRDGIIAKRAPFTQHHIWVTSYKDRELFAAGQYTNQSNGKAQGLEYFAGRRDNVDNTDIVLWHTFALTHIPRVEDFPVMPVETHMISLKPCNFFDANPALDVPLSNQAFNKSSTIDGPPSSCCGTGNAAPGGNGMQRKRTRKEMEEARSSEVGGVRESLNRQELGEATTRPDAAPAAPDQTNDASAPDWLGLLTTPAASSAYVWPDVFLQPVETGLELEAMMGDTTLPSLSASVTDQRLIQALENQAAVVQQGPDQEEGLQLYYYRFSGSTAIQPGVNRINLRLQRRTADSPTTSVPQPVAPDVPPSPSRALSDIFDTEGMPFTHIREPLFELFYRHLSQHFPAISRQRMNERLASGTMSQFLANCICALGARFVGDPQEPASQASGPFMAKALELVVPLTSLPATETTSGLILLAWASYGQGNDSGLWQFSGMAIRMGMDIGIHEVSEIYDSPQHVVRTRLLFWTLFITDRIIAFVTGRPASISEEVVEIPLPEDRDLSPDPARNTNEHPIELVEPVPFVYFVRLMIIVGRISNVLNGRRGKPRTLVTTPELESGLLDDLQVRLVQFFSTLPESLRWSADNFKHQHERGHSGMYLALHLWAHAVLALTYHPDLLKSASGTETPFSKSMSRNVQLALASSRQISECMVFADLVAKETYTSTPYLVQPLYVAGTALVQELGLMSRGNPAVVNPTDMFFVSLARQNFASLMKALCRMGEFWAAVDPVISILEKRSGMTRPDAKTRRNILISLPDHGLLRRFAADKNHPDNIAQPTDTSLRDSIARAQQNGPSEL